jgi:F-type H+-transporting ATPase subunit delta
MAEPAQASDRISAYAEGLYSVARAEGDPGRVVDELFTFSRVLEGADELRDKLTDAHIPVTTRQQIIEDLLGVKAHPATASLVGMVVSTGRIRQLPAIVAAMVELRARAGDKEVAEVHSAVPLTDDQVSRLADALHKATGKFVDVRVIVDESVKGGIVARVGDTVIDGSVRRRLEMLRNSLS